MRKTDNTESSQYKTMLWITMAFSLMFIYVLSNGYYNMFIDRGRIIAGMIGLVLALLAWGLGKFIGSSSKGISGHLPFFVLLLTVSAVGVFNSMMINMEGKQVFTETVDQAKVDFKDLANAAEKILYNDIAAKKEKKIADLQDGFFAELGNPQLCGQGPRARQLAELLSAELPGFRVLAGGGDCKKIPELIGSYTKSIQKLLMNHPDLTGYQELQDFHNRIKESEAIGQARLDEIKKEIATGEDLLGKVRPELEDIASTYQTLATELAAKPSKVSFKSSLDLSSVRSLGAWGQLLSLVMSRTDKPATYVYLLLAFGFDWILVYFFKQLTEARGALPKGSRGPITDIKSHWQ